MSDINRRTFGAATAAALGFPAVLAARGRAADKPAEEQFGRMHNRPVPVVGMLLYPGLTLMDLFGPQTVFSTSCKVHLVWKTKDPVRSDTGVGVVPDTTLDECPKDLDVLFVGGGGGQAAVMQDPDVLGFMADRGSRAKWVTSVCSGSLVLGAAGLLKGYKSACHWAALDLLPLFGATPVAERVVTDRNRCSGGGVTAGIDFGLVLLAKLLGEDVAKMTQLAMEYDPQPPYTAGSPEGAGPEVVKKVRAWMEPVDKHFRQTCAAAGKAMDQYTPAKK